MSTSVADLIEAVVGPEPGVAFEAWDGSRLGPVDAPATVVIRRREALSRIATAPGELGLGRAFVAGDADIEGDIYAVLALKKQIPSLRLGLSEARGLLDIVGIAGLRPLPPPPEEVRRLHGWRHSKARDASAISHHYDVSNDFYRIVLGPAMTYSCAVWTSLDATLLDAQAAKHELICRKLDLRPGMRLLDVGCGWGSLAMHAARFHGVHAVGVTISRPQAELARERIEAAGLGDRVEIRVQDYRDVHDGPYDAVSSVGMFEHVGAARLAEYFDDMHALLRPAGRFMNHGISRPPGAKRARFARRGFIERYVFPDGELHEVGAVVSAMQRAGFEVRDVESLREHYALTLRAWVRNLEDHWRDAVALVGEGRARVWRIYMAGCAVAFEDGGVQIHQTLGTRSDNGRSGMALRRDWERTPLVEPLDLGVLESDGTRTGDVSRSGRSG